MLRQSFRKEIDRRWLTLLYILIIFINKKQFLINMARNDKVQMPSSGAGLTRYFDDYKSKIEIKPGHVIILIVVVIIIEVILHLQGYNLLGLG